jgi:hypothetical protein
MTIDTRLKTVGTVMTLSDGHDVLPFYSARGIIHNIGSIGAAKVQRRTVNFQLINLALTRSQKYTLTISAKDIRPPARDNVWPGKTVTVACGFYLSYATSGGSPSRSPVSGSQFDDGHGFTFYRPYLDMMIGELPRSYEEWNATNDWHINMEEV